MRPKRWLTVALVVLVVVALAGGATYARHRTRVSRHTLGALAVPDAGLILSGVLSPVATTPIEAPVGDLAVPLNSYVTKEQIVGETVSSVFLDSPDETGSALARAQADVSRAEADLDAARAREIDAAVQQVVTKGAERATEQSCANAGLQFQEGQMSAARYKQAVLAVDSAMAAAGATRFQAEADTSAVADATMRLQEARARLAETERQWQFALPATRRVRRSGQLAVVSPADGLLVARDPDAGTFGISSDPSAMRVQVRMPADELPRLRVGQTAWVWLDARPQLTFRATVNEIAGVPIDSPNGTVYPVTLLVDNPQGIWLTGVQVHVRATSPETGSR
jgi:HlyD family secretion protein